MFLIFLTFAIFAAAICVNKFLLFSLPPTLFVGIRMFLSGIILMIYGWRKSSPIGHIKTDWLTIVGIAIFTTFVPAILKAYGLSKLTAAHATLIGSIDPFVTALYAYLLWGERLSVNKSIGIIVGCIGIIISINLSNIQLGSCINTLLPQLALVISILFSRYGWSLVGMLLKKDRYQPAQLNSLVMTASGILALMAAAFIDAQKNILLPPLPQFFAALTFTIIIGNVIGYTLYSYVLKHNNATLISLAGFSIPLLVGFYSWIFLHEPLSLRYALAAAVLFCGLLIFYYDNIKKLDKSQSHP